MFKNSIAMSRPLLKVIKVLVVVSLLTILTQVGGIIYLLYFLVKNRIEKVWANTTRLRILKPILFVGMYFLFSLTLVPLLARYYGRVPLPIAGDATLKPLSAITWIFNRHYVKPALKDIAMGTASKLSKRYPGTVLYYLDANFPFIDGFALWPHLSHNDGKKLDLAFCYLTAIDRSRTNKKPSMIGYGVFVDPVRGEADQPSNCKQLGFWQYGFMEYLVPQGKKEDFVLDKERTKTMIRLFSDNKQVKKIFIEPHLKTRMGLVHDKIRYHGCHAVRHDDHIHIQI